MQEGTSIFADYRPSSLFDELVSDFSHDRPRMPPDSLGRGCCRVDVRDRDYSLKQLTRPGVTIVSVERQGSRSDPTVI
jgi:hypothetical protein